MTKAINPLDGRYQEKTSMLAPFFSEQALMKYRVIMEGEYLIALSSLGKTGLKKFTEIENKKIRSLYDLSDADFEKIKELEAIVAGIPK